MGAVTTQDLRPNNTQEILNKLRNTDKNIFNKKSFIKVDCVCCGSGKSKKLFIKNSFTFQECQKCKTQFISPRPPTNEMKKFYKRSEYISYLNNKIFPATQEKRVSNIVKPILEELRKVVDFKKKSFLKLGAYNSLFCKLIDEKSVYFLSDGNVDKFSKKISVNEYNYTISSKIKSNQKFDVIISIGDLEHTDNPKKLIKKISDISTKEAVIYLATVNGQGFDFSILGKKSPSYEYEILNYLNPNSLSKLLEKHGFKILSVETPGNLDVEIVKSVYKNANFNSIPFINELMNNAHVEIQSNFQNFLKTNKLSSYMHIIAKKEGV